MIDSEIAVVTVVTEVDDELEDVEVVVDVELEDAELEVPVPPVPPL